MVIKYLTKIKRYIGESGDSKPTEGVPAGSTFHETDTNDDYIYDGSSWVQHWPAGGEIWP